jgi:hypothetical protein
MTRNPQEGRTREQIRAANRRLGLILLSIVIVLFFSFAIKQWLWG